MLCLCMYTFVNSLPVKSTEPESTGVCAPRSAGVREEELCEGQDSAAGGPAQLPQGGGELVASLSKGLIALHCCMLFTYI